MNQRITFGGVEIRSITDNRWLGIICSTNKRSSLSKWVASKWLNAVVYTSSTDSLWTAGNRKYGESGKNTKGNVLYLYLTPCKMIHMSKEVKNAMLTFIKFFKKHGIAK